MAEKNFFTPQQSICAGNRLIDLRTPKVMAILNLTPDSFHAASRTTTIDAALHKTAQFLAEGATFIDVGAYSSRPGASDISVDEELKRLIPTIEKLAKTFPEALISVDTFRAKVAEEAVLAGASLVNDISGGDLDAAMFALVAKLQVPYIMMHMQGTPQTMQLNPTYDHVVLSVFDAFEKKLAQLRDLHLHDVILDPGFGFGKTTAHNYQLLDELNTFNIFKVPLLVGFSRKGMIYKTLGITPDEALNGTTVLHTIALQKGAKILRVHDVREAVECIKLVAQLSN